MFWIPDNGGYYSTFIWHELALWRNGKVSRAPHLLERDAILPYMQPPDQQPGVYASIFAYNGEDIENAQSICPLFFDIDCEDLRTSHTDAGYLVEYLQEYIPLSAINIYFSGGKGFHIEVEPVALGIVPSPNLPKLMRFIGTSIAKELNIPTIDTVVWEQRRMWRMPNTQHQKTGFFKVQLTKKMLFTDSLETIKDYAKTRQPLKTVPQEFNSHANEWFKEFEYSQHETHISLEERIKKFNQYGSTILKDADTELVFDPTGFDRCQAMRNLWTKAEQERQLTHPERLFLLSILSYNDEALTYLKSIISQCDDFREEITDAHVRDWIKRREFETGGRPMTCNTAQSYGIACEDCVHMQRKEKLERIGNQLIPSGELAEASPVRFFYYRKKK